MSYASFMVLCYETVYCGHNPIHSHTVMRSICGITICDIYTITPHITSSEESQRNG